MYRIAIILFNLFCFSLSAQDTLYIWSAEEYAKTKAVQAMDRTIHERVLSMAIYKEDCFEWEKEFLPHYTNEQELQKLNFEGKNYSISVATMENFSNFYTKDGQDNLKKKWLIKADSALAKEANEDKKERIKTLREFYSKNTVGISVIYNSPLSILRLKSYSKKGKPDVVHEFPLPLMYNGTLSADNLPIKLHGYKDGILAVTFNTKDTIVLYFFQENAKSWQIILEDPIHYNYSFAKSLEKMEIAKDLSIMYYKNYLHTVHFELMDNKTITVSIIENKKN